MAYSNDDIAAMIIRLTNQLDTFEARTESRLARLDENVTYALDEIRNHRRDPFGHTREH